MVYAVKLANKSLNNRIFKRLPAHFNRNLSYKVRVFTPKYHESADFCRFYGRRSLSTSNSAEISPELLDKLEITDDLGENPPKSSLITTDPSNLTFSLIEDAFDTAATEYSKNLSTSEFIDRNNESSLGPSAEFDGMTPAQKFYAENKEKLINNARKIFLENSGKIDAISNVEEPVIRPPKNHVWEYGSITIADHKQHIVLQKGQMPTINDIINILEREHFVDSVTINLDECNRRDIGLYAIITTGKTFSHCRRVGRLLYRIFVDLDIPFVSQISYARSSRNDEWIIAHLGPLHVYLMTKELRELYKLEEFWSNNSDITTNVIESNNSALNYIGNDELKRPTCDTAEIQHLESHDLVYNKFKKDDDYG